MKVEELKKLIKEKELEDYWHDFVYESWNKFSTDEDSEPFLPFEIKWVYDEIIRTDDGNPWIKVFQIGEQYFRIDGYYDSWGDGGFDDYMDFYEVKPKEVIIKKTEWERV